jgi:hypothetical protein
MNQLMNRLRAFGMFWYDFVVGDDWRVAVWVLLALGATAALTAADVNAWWLLPVTAAAALADSLRRAVGSARKARNAREAEETEGAEAARDR